MARKWSEISTDHDGNPLPAGVYGLVDEAGKLSSYKVRWREEDEDGVGRHRSKSFSVRKFGSAARALNAAIEFRRGAVAAVRVDGAVQPIDAAAAMTVEELFQEWCVKRGADLSEGYGKKVVRYWDQEIGSRSISRVRLERLSRDPAILTRFQDDLATEGMGAAKRREILKTLRSVLRWGRRRHPNVLTVEFSGLFEIPSASRRRLAYAADAYALERIIEAVLGRAKREELLPLRDAAFVAAMGFTVAARPSEWLNSATWVDLQQRSVELQRAADVGKEGGVGLKTGARAALLLPNARERILVYRKALEARYGKQPDQGLVFQKLDDDGPVWETTKDGTRIPVPWSDDDYKRWTARVWRPARDIAAKAPGAPKGLAAMTFYDCRHTAISMALHSTLVVGPHGMNLHTLAGWAGHDIQTLQRYYAHFIARYQGKRPIDLEAECKAARRRVQAKPFKPAKSPAGPQRGAQRRRRVGKSPGVAPARR
jgi:AP2 domain